MAVLFSLSAICQVFVVVDRYTTISEGENPCFETRGTTVPARGRVEYPANLVRVIDGDTYALDIRIWEDLVLTKRIRLFGVDTPELRPRNGSNAEKEAEKAKAVKAAQFVEDAFSGKRLFFVSEGKSDSFGRALGTVVWYNEEDEVDIRQELQKANLLK